MAAACSTQQSQYKFNNTSPCYCISHDYALALAFCYTYLNNAQFTRRKQQRKSRYATDDKQTTSAFNPSIRRQDNIKVRDDVSLAKACTFDMRNCAAIHAAKTALLLAELQFTAALPPAFSQHVAQVSLRELRN